MSCVRDVRWRLMRLNGLQASNDEWSHMHCTACDLTCCAFERCFSFLLQEERLDFAQKRDAQVASKKDKKKTQRVLMFALLGVV